MNKNKELCPKCFGSKEVISQKKGYFKSSECKYCEVDADGKPTGLVPLEEDIDEPLY